MAFFKFRWPGQNEDADQQPSRRSRNAQTESVESLRRRARHRLIGAAVLVLVGVVGFPLLFDTQPRPIAVDVPIEIPDRNQVAPMVVPGEHITAAASPRGVATAPAAAAPAAVQTENSLDAGEEVFTPVPRIPVLVPPRPQVAAPAAPEVKKPEPRPEVKKPEPKVELKKPEIKVEHKPEPKPEPRVEVKKPEPKVEPKPEPKPEPKKPAQDTDADRARALLEGRTAAVPAAAHKADERFVVQVGAFGDTGKAEEVRQKLAGAGLKAYTQAVNAAAGKVTRVRVGPFNGRAEADKAAARIKGLGLPASVQPG